MPLLKDKSFFRDWKCRIYSRSDLELGSGRKWFDTPCFEFDSEAIAIEVPDRLFTHALFMKERKNG
jgi:hypothetical protein